MPKFKPGNPGGPGRPKGSVSGRVQALTVLDAVLAADRNKKKLREFLQEEFDKSPTKFFRTYAIPLMPKDSLVDEPDELVINVSITGKNGEIKT